MLLRVPPALFDAKAFAAAQSQLKLLEHARVASGGGAYGGDNTVRVWDVATKECVATLEGHTDFVYAVCGLGDGSRIASGSNDNTVRVWLR